MAAWLFIIFIDNHLLIKGLQPNKFKVGQLLRPMGTVFAYPTFHTHFWYILCAYVMSETEIRWQSVSRRRIFSITSLALPSTNMILHWFLESRVL